MGLIEILGIIIIHWFADFVIQTDEQAKGKSKNWSDLLEHTWNYSIIWVGVGAFYVCPGWNWNDGNPTSLFFYWTWMGIFPLVTFVFHTATDYFTSRLNSRLWGEGRVHDFFVSVGFDQVLHYVQLFVTFYLLNLLWT